MRTVKCLSPAAADCIVSVYCIRPHPSLVPDTSRGLAWCGEDAGRRAGAGTEWDLMGSGGACWVA